ncbi:MAG: tetratricopeptide repeat protein [Deltaproteobacteria bacterium]|nr:tetratricopeptide repeat protein [Deltaproteobacteria bacterium]
MKKFLRTVMNHLMVVFLTLVLVSPAAFGQADGSLQEGIKQYGADNYEEAADLFKKARREMPKSTIAAFWLGMANKQLNNLPEAVAPLTDAVTMDPPLKEALIELIDVHYRLEQFDDAAKWIAVAEKDNIYPAKTAFLKGMVLARQARYEEAVRSFEKSKSLDKTYTQSAELQIGLCYMLDRKYAKASDRFRAAVTQDPLSDLGSFARRYQDFVEDRKWIERPLRFTLNVMGQYDTNMLTEPDSHPGLPDAGEEESLAMLNTIRLDAVPVLPGGWLFNASYAGTWKLHEMNSTGYDMLAHTLSVAPGYRFGRVAVNLTGNYTHVMKRQPSYRPYSEFFSAGPMIRFLLTPKQNHILELYAGCTDKRYDNYQGDGELPLDPAENRTSKGFNSYLSWMWLFRNGAIFNFKYGYGRDEADGNNWSNQAHSFTLNTIIPLSESLKFQIGGEATLQDYLNNSTWAIFDNKRRSDRIYTAAAGLTWDINKYLSVLAQYNWTKADSNIFIYDYNRNIFSAGLEFRY